MILYGTGSEGNPYILEVAAGATKLVGVGSSYLNVTVAGQGTAPNPYVISMDKSGLTAPSSNQQTRTFLTPAPVVVVPPGGQPPLVPSGTWAFTKPAGVRLVEAILVGGGMGGQGGGWESGYPSGGHGGAGGAWTRVRLACSSAEADGLVIVGPGGVGGPGASGGASVGGLGIYGGFSQVTLEDPAGDMTVRAVGGGVLSSDGYGTVRGQAEAASYAPLLTAAAGAGGRGASYNVTVGPLTGQPGGTHALYATTAEAVALRRGGNGGAGGEQQNVGAPGIFPGGGGGGGGAATTAPASGGRGADGAVWLIFY
jgi:hypothetical protein